MRFACRARSLWYIDSLSDVKENTPKRKSLSVRSEMYSFVLGNGELYRLSEDGRRDLSRTAQL
jgi:hypothetical protein